MRERLPEFPALHGAIADGGLASFLAAAEASAVYGQVEIVTRTGRVSLTLISGRLGVEGAIDGAAFENGVSRLRSELRDLVSLPTGAYRCGPLLHHSAADGRLTVAVSDVLQELDDRHPQTVETPAGALSTPSAQFEQAAPQPHPVPLERSSEATSGATHTAIESPRRVAVASVALQPAAALDPADPADIRPVRASTLRRLLRTPSENTPATHKQTESIEPQPEPTRANALRSLLKGLATKD